MSIPELPYNPSAEPADRQRQADPHDPGAPASRAPRGGQPKLPTREECLAAVHQSAGLVALGLLTPAQANSMRGSYTVLLKEFGNQAAAGPTLTNESVVELLRTNPRLLSSFAPFLSEEQLRLIARGGGPDDAQ